MAKQIETLGTLAEYLETTGLTLTLKSNGWSYTVTLLGKRKVEAQYPTLEGAVQRAVVCYSALARD